MEENILESGKSKGAKSNIKIMFLSAEKTGSGHKSITSSLSHHLKNIEPNVEVSVIDSFSLGNGLVSWTGNSYNFFAVYLPTFWSFVYKLGDFTVRPVASLFALLINKRLMKYINEFKPDIIVSVHALFVGSVLSVLKRNNLNIPVVPVIADLDNVAYLWADKRSACTICPSLESKKTMLKRGLQEEKLRITGFPVRAEFCDELKENNSKNLLNKSCNKFMIVSGSQGSTQILRTTEALLECKDSSVTIIAGNNKILKSYLEKELSKYGNRVNILGFTKEIKKYMMEADILIVRASPNVVMEAINLNKPIIVTGSLMGQEAKNPDYIARHGLGIVCKDTKKLPRAIEILLDNNCKKLYEIKENQRNFIKKNAALEISEIIMEEYYKSQDLAKN